MSPESFEERWRALAEELSDLDSTTHVVHPAQPPELSPVVFPDDAAPPDPVDLALPGPRDWEAAELDEHFEPPDAPPVLAGDPSLILAWVGLVGGLVAIIVWAVASSTIDVWVARFGLLASVLGLGMLLWRMPHRRDPESTDNGAQV
jgi:hypothetical protein